MKITNLIDTYKLIALLGLMVASSFGEGISLLLLIPLLHYTGITPNGGSDHTQWLQQFIPNHANLLIVLGIYISIVIGFACLNYAKSLYSARLQQQTIQSLREKVYSAVCYAPWSLLAKQTPSDISQMLTTEIQRISSGLQQGLTLVTNTIMTLSYLTIALYLSWPITMIALIGCSLLLLITRSQTVYAKRNGHHAFQFFRELHKNIEQTLQGIRQAKLWQSEQQYIANLQNLNLTLNKNQIQFTKSQAATQWLMTTGGVIIISALFYVSTHVFHTAISHILVLIVAFARLLPKVSSSQRSYQLMINSISGLKPLQKFYQQCMKHSEQRHEHIHLPRLTTCIRVNALCYKHPNQPKPILNNISITIPANQITAITGHSGCGKSTLMDCLTGMLQPQSGTIDIDGHLLSDSSRRSWQSQIAYVSQDPFLLHDSLRANFKWIYPSVTDHAIWQALELAGAKQFVDKLPKQLDTLVGHRGLRLSGGERQRIVLAQAILRKPSLLVLDEATSQLDNHHEQLIQNTLKNLTDTTIVVVAHRFSTLALADRIIFLDNGQANCVDSLDHLQSHYALNL